MPRFRTARPIQLTLHETPTMLVLASFLFFTGLVAVLTWFLTRNDDHDSSQGPAPPEATLAAEHLQDDDQKEPFDVAAPASQSQWRRKDTSKRSRLVKRTLLNLANGGNQLQGEYRM